MSTASPTNEPLGAVLVSAGGALGRLRGLVERMTGAGIAVTVVDDLDEAAHAVLRDPRSHPCVMIAMPRTAADLEDVRYAEQRLREVGERLPTVLPIVVSEDAAPLFLLACVRAGAGDVIDLTLEGTSQVRNVVMRVRARQIERERAAARERSLREILDEFLRDLIRTERRTIDLEEQLARRERRSTNEILASVDPSPHRQPTVLLVGGDRRTSDYVAESLEEVGVASFAYLSGEDALRGVEQHLPDGVHFDLALIDQQLPGMNGLAAIRLLRNSLPNLSAFLLTGDSEPSFAADVADLGVSGFVYKPVDDLPRLVRRLRDLATESMTRHREALYLQRIKERHERVLLRYRKVSGDLE